MTHSISMHLMLLALACLTPLACSARSPVEPGQVLTISRSRPSQDSPAAETDLRVRWLGTACHIIQMGDLTILTDPFVSYHGLLDVGLGSIASHRPTVNRLLPDQPAPDAIFIGHSHYDHMLDLGTLLERDAWRDVAVFASPTAGKTMCGWGSDVAAHWRPAHSDGQWHNLRDDGRLQYLAVPAQHAPNIPGIVVYSGDHDHCLTSPPTRAADFKLGDTFAYFFKLRSQGVEFTVFFMGAAADYPAGLPPDLPSSSIDLAILCVPGWKHVQGYPHKYVEALKPRHILLTHFDDFFQADRSHRRTVATAHLEDFLQVLQASASYPGFESIIVPDVGAELHLPGRGLRAPNDPQVLINRWNQNPP